MVVLRTPRGRLDRTRGDARWTSHV